MIPIKPARLTLDSVGRCILCNQRKGHRVERTLYPSFVCDECYGSVGNGRFKLKFRYKTPPVRSEKTVAVNPGITGQKGEITETYLD